MRALAFLLAVAYPVLVYAGLELASPRTVAALLAAALVIFSALRISADPTQDTTLKVYALVLGGVSFAAILLGGFLVLFS